MTVLPGTDWRSKKGLSYEKLAADYLRKQGLKLLASNYRCPLGELDLVMNHADILVFVEVRYRENRDYGGALATVTRSKQQKLLLTARHFLLNHRELQHHACRFDVIGMETGNNGSLEISWIENAFS